MAENSRITCSVCPRRCVLSQGQVGFCRARWAQGAVVVAQNYGRVTSLALDPIEKKPLALFHPGVLVLSVGSYGCNMRCPFCQNHTISQCGGEALPWEEWPPEKLADRAAELAERGNLGLAFTYNEPTVGWEYVRDAARAVRARGLKTVVVSNGYFCPAVMDALAPLIDAWNIDLKCFTAAGYHSLGGNLGTVQQNLRRAQAGAHLEVTTLVVPGLSDGEADMERQAAWLAALSPEIPLHLSRYFPRWQASASATAPEVLRRLASIAKKYLKHVYLGNI